MANVARYWRIAHRMLLRAGIGERRTHIEDRRTVLQSRTA
jgi:hypothetical protein